MFVDRAAVPLESVKRHCCDGRAVVITETSDGEPLGIGRRTRLVPKAASRATAASRSQLEPGKTITAVFMSCLWMFPPFSRPIPC